MSKSGLGISIDTLYRQVVLQTRQSHGFGSRKGESFRAWQKRLGKKLLELLAIAGKPRSAPPVRFVQEERMDGYIRRRGYMIADDELAVPFYVLEPDPKPKGKMGVCMAAVGHSKWAKDTPVGIIHDEDDRESIEEGQRDYAVQAVRRGYLAISPDWRGFGELVLAEDIDDERNGCWQLSMRAMQLGRPLLGQRVSDAMQLLDWALARKDTDRRRVVMTGNSGGGTMTLFTSAVDKRITASAPSCYFSTFAGSIMAMWHCPCNFVPGIQPVAEMSDLAGLFAPKPMLIIAGTKDTIFPIDAVREGFANLKKIYAAAGVADNVELYEGPGGHRYYSARVWDFFREKLPGD